jgi:hypothetical protein
MIGDLLTAFIGLIAIGLTTYTIGQTREQRRLDAFTRMHDLLISEESQRGRRMLYAASDSGSWPKRDSPEWDQMNRALAMLETLAMYRAKKIVDPELTMESWYHAFRRIQGPAEQFMNIRAEDYPIWPYLRAMFREAETYQSRNPPIPLAAPAEADPREPIDEPRGISTIRANDLLGASLYRWQELGAEVVAQLPCLLRR